MSVNFYDLDYETRNKYTKLFANWLNDYTHEVVIAVLSKRNEIINNTFAMNMLEELYNRENEEYADFEDSVGMLLREFEETLFTDIHNHPITHANSYRDILYDMYIR